MDCSPLKSVHGFDSPPRHEVQQNSSSSKRGRASVRRQASMLQAALASCPAPSCGSALSRESSMVATDSFGDLTQLAETPGEGTGSPCPTSSSEEGLAQCSSEEPSGSPCSGPSPALAIPYTRRARAKLDAAERQGRAFDQQLELLAAVRAYFAEQGSGLPAAPLGL